MNSLLPVEYKKEDFIKKFKSSNVTIVISETGSGKSTKIPIFILDWYKSIGIKSPKILVSQTRRVAAITISKWVAKKLNFKLGDEIGYAVRFLNKFSSVTMLKYVTDGVLIRELVSDPILKNYNCIILDEVHQRSLFTDIIISLIYRILLKRKDLKVVIMSATIQIEKFLNLFPDAAIIEIPGRLYPVKIIYSKTLSDNFIIKTTKKIIKIHNKSSYGDILAFLPGEQEINCVERKLLNLISKFNLKNLIIHKLFSNLPQKLQEDVIYNYFPSKKKRRVVLSTNIAETSVTIQGIRYVIDSGYEKTLIYNSKRRINQLKLSKISKESAIQRSGRAGRTSPGKCYRIYTKDFYSNLNESTAPEIVRTELSSTFLLLCSIGINDFSLFKFLDTPPLENILQALETLYFIKALDFDGKITPLGKILSRFPLDPRNAVSIYYAIHYNCLDHVIKIISILSVPSIINLTVNSTQYSPVSNWPTSYPNSEHLTYFEILSAFDQSKAKKLDICKKFGFNFNNLNYALNLSNQINIFVRKYINNLPNQPLDLVDLSSFSLPSRVLFCLLCGNYFSLAIKTTLKHKSTAFYTIYNHHIVYKNYSRLLIKNFKPSDIILFGDIIQIEGKKYISILSSIDNSLLTIFIQSNPSFISSLPPYAIEMLKKLHVIP